MLLAFVLLLVLTILFIFPVTYPVVLHSRPVIVLLFVKLSLQILISLMLFFVTLHLVYKFLKKRNLLRIML